MKKYIAISLIATFLLSAPFALADTVFGQNIWRVLSSKVSTVVSSWGLGVGTTTPYATLAIQGQSGQSNPLFEIASSTESVLFSVASGGNVSITGDLAVSGSFTGSVNLGADPTLQGLLTVGQIVATSTTASSTFWGVDAWNSFGVGGSATTTIVGDSGTSTFSGGITTAGFSSSAGLAITSISEGMLYIDSEGLVRKATDGRSLTYSSGTLDVDSELYTKSFSVNIASSTMSTTTGRFIQHKINKAITITQISCTSNSTTASSTVQIDERTSPNTAGTDVMYSTGLGLAGIGCDSGETSTTTFSNASIAANSILNFTVETPAVVNSTSPTILNLFVFYTIND